MNNIPPPLPSLTPPPLPPLPPLPSRPPSSNFVVDTMLSVVVFLTIPLVFMNIFGGVISGIWLAVLGEWKAIGMGVILIIVSAIGLGFVLMPSLIFALPATRAIEAGKNSLAAFLGGLTMIYTGVVMLCWAIIIFVYYYKASDSSSLIPMLFWSYGVATAPWSHMAKSDQQAGNNFSAIPVFFLSIGYLVMIIAVLIVGPSLLASTIILGVFILIGIIFVISAAIQEDKVSRRIKF